MKIELHEIPISEVFNGYKDSAENGVVAYGGKLNVRPAFQREFVYKEKQRDEVIRTVKNGYPLNVMYWAKSGDDTYEMLDGQQRTISICQYLEGDFSVDYQYFHNIQKSYPDQAQSIMDYKLMIYICEGTDKEKLDWFKIINIAGVQLTDQELRNAIYTGPWLTEAKKYFSKTGCPASSVAGDYMSGSPIRQDYLAAALSWICEKQGIEIEEYMAQHQLDTNCNELWLYFNSVISWVQATFPNYRKEMAGLPWGIYYNHHEKDKLDPGSLEKEILMLIDDDEVTARLKAYYIYLLERDPKHLSLREFPDKMKKKKYQEQQGICANCGKHFEYDEMEGDHIKPWTKGGKTEYDNLQMLCKHCNATKQNKW